MTVIEGLLSKAVGKIVRLQHPGGMLTGDGATRFLAQLRHGRFNQATGVYTGFKREGVAAISDVTRQLRSSSAQYMRGITASALANKVADTILEQFGAPNSLPVDQGVVAAFEATIAAWFAREAISRRHYIGCSVAPVCVKPFKIGPVTFIHGQDFQDHELGMKADHALSQLTLDQLYGAMKASDASWIAVVNVDGCHSSRSIEVADLAVDVAIGTLQLTVPTQYSERMTRITARALPSWRADISISGGNTQGEIADRRPALGVSAAIFQQSNQVAEPLFNAAGKCLATFVTGGTGSLPILRQAWVDAVYWFHEALAEPLDTVATAKLETAVEILLRAKKTSGSTTRMLKAFHAFSNLKKDDLIGDNIAISVEQFAKAAVKARSRILHGTCSTLTEELALERNQLTPVVIHFLTTYATLLGPYEQQFAAQDDVDSLLDWIEAQKGKAGG